MTQRQISIRIGLDGKADIQRDMNDIASTGDATFGQLGKALDQGTAAIQRQKDAFDKLSEAQKNVQTQKANQNAFNQILGVNPGSGAGSAQASAQAFQSQLAGMEARAAALRAQIDPLGAAQNKMNAALADANTLLAAGAIGETEHAAAVTLARKAYADAEGALKSFGAMEGLGSTQAMALTAAIRHMIDATIAGRPPIQSLAMEAGNLSYGLSGSGGVLNAVKALGSGIGEFLLSPLGLTVAAFLAVGGAAVAGYMRATEAEKELEEATSFAGRAVGVTKDQLEGMAESAARADDISVASARGIETAFAKTGSVGGQALTGLIALTKEYSDKTDLGMSEARDALVKAFSDPKKAGEALLAQLGGLDDKTRETIDTLTARGDAAGAESALEDALTKALKREADQTTLLGDAWAWVTRNVSDAVEALGHVPTTQESLTNAQAQLARYQGLAKNSAYYNPYVTYWQNQVDFYKAQADAANAQAKGNAADAAAQTLSLQAGPLVRNAIPGFKDLQTLQSDKAVLDQVSGNQAALAKLGATQADVTAAQDAYTRAIQTYLDPATKAQKLNELEIAALNDKTPAQKRATAEARTALEISGKAITTAEANREIQAAGAKAYAEATHAIHDQTSAVKDNADAWIAVADAYLKGSAAGMAAEESSQKLQEQIGRTATAGARQAAQIAEETAARKSLNDQVASGQITSEQAAQEMAVQRALAPLLIAQALAEGDAKKELTKIIEALTAARAGDNAEQIRTKALAEVEAGNRNIDLLKQELAIANDNDSARQVELAYLEAKQKLLSENIPLESDEGRQILANATDAAVLNQQLDLAKQSRGEVEGLFDSVSGKFASFITQGKYDWKDFSSAAMSALQDIESEMIKLAVLNPLKNMIFGTNLPTLGSVGSGLFGGSLFGSDSSAAGTLDAGTTVSADFGIAHTGAMAGYANTNRALPANVLRFAPRFHSGVFLGPDEVPAILQTGERVLNRAETKRYNSGDNGGVVMMPGSVVIQTPSPQAFHASSGQVAAKLARAVRDGVRRM